MLRQLILPFRRRSSPGTQHFIEQVREEMEDIFISMGYTIETGPYVETLY